jgi:uncharacterized RDD family membrane protein YckC
MSKTNQKQKSHPDNNTIQAASQPSEPISPKFTYPTAGFWRRMFAFLIDLVILGIPAEVLGWVLMPWINKLGNASQLIGFIFVLPYFGMMNSSLRNGQTLGKTLLNLSVRRNNGDFLSPLQSVLRTFVLFGYMFFNGITGFFPNAPFVNNVLFAIGLGLIVGLVLLYLINKETRQTGHDLIFDTRVVDLRKKTKEKPAKMAKYAWIIALAFALITVGGQIVVANRSSSQPVNSSLSAISENLTQEYNLSRLTFADQTVQTNSNNETQTTNTLMVRAYVPEKMSNERINEICSKLAAEIQQKYAEIGQYDAINVTVYYGFNLGFVSFNSNYGMTYPLSK